MKQPHLASCAVVFGVFFVVACGDAFIASSNDGSELNDAGADRIDPSAGPDGSIIGSGGDDAHADVALSCPSPGVTRACKETPGAVQTCVPSDSPGGAYWSLCERADCTGVAPPANTACIPAGTFTMGGLDNKGSGPNDTMPSRAVTIAHRFFLDRFEVTVADFTAWWNSGAPQLPQPGALHYVSGSGDVPRFTQEDLAAVSAAADGHDCTINAGKALASVNCVNRATALAYCIAQNGRLPTEAEWEYAASGQGKGSAYPWGADSLLPSEERGCLLTIDAVCMNGPYAAQYPFPRPSATDGNTSAMLGGINNLAGNVAEWTLDEAPPLGAACTNGTCWPSGVVDPWQNKDNGTGAVLRGGSYRSSADQVQTRARAYANPKMPEDPPAVGFRCVRELMPTK